MSARRASVCGTWRLERAVVPKRELDDYTSLPSEELERKSPNEILCQRVREELRRPEVAPLKAGGRFELRLRSDGRYVERFLGSEHLSGPFADRFHVAESEYGGVGEREPLWGTWEFDEETGMVSLSEDPWSEVSEQFHEGGFRDSVLAFDGFTLCRPAESCDFFSREHIGVYLRAQEPRPSMDAGQRLVEVRQLLAGAPSRFRWELLCWHVEASEGSLLEAELVDYIQVHTGSWPLSTCLLHWRWWERLLEGESFSGLRLIRNLERQGVEPLQLERLSSSEGLTGLERLSLSHARWGKLSCQELFHSPLTSSLRHLRLHVMEDWKDKEGYALADATHLTGLETLTLSQLDFQWPTWDAIEQAPQFSETTLELNRGRSF